MQIGARMGSPRITACVRRQAVFPTVNRKRHGHEPGWARSCCVPTSGRSDPFQGQGERTSLRSCRRARIHLRADDVGAQTEPGKRCSGNVSVHISSDGEEAVITGDIGHHPSDCPPRRGPASTADRAAGRATRQQCR
jgi:hypothetical protein